MADTAQQTETRRSRERSRQRIVDAATELVRERSYAELSVGEIMDRADSGGRSSTATSTTSATCCCAPAGRRSRSSTRPSWRWPRPVIGTTPTPCGRRSRRRSTSTAATARCCARVSRPRRSDPRVAAARGPALARFDELVAEALRGLEAETGRRFADPAETARALNLLAEAYLLDAYGREPRVAQRTAVATLTEIWSGMAGH